MTREKGEGKGMDEIGLRIRNERKSRGWSLGEMAGKIGINPMTLQRIETGKRSPSVVMLAEIAHQLLKPIDYFIKEKNPQLVLVKKEQQTVIESPKLKLTVIAPKGLIDEKIYLNLGEAKKGKFIDSHVDEGYSLVYILDGECIVEHNGKKYVHRKGDTLYYDARYRHSVTANGPVRFISVFFRGR
jgi:transcriptional regulator with XRE-family HTH domain